MTVLGRMMPGETQRIAGAFRLYRAMISLTEEERKRYRVAWLSARRRAANFRACIDEATATAQAAVEARDQAIAKLATLESNDAP